MRIALDETATLTKTFNVENIDVDNGTVTVTVKNLDGDTVSTGTATKTATTDPDGFIYSYDLPAQDTLGQLKVIWAGTKTESYYVEVVGAHLFELSELRSRLAAGGFKGAYTDGQLRAVRDVVADTFDRVCGTSFVRRRVAELVDTRGTYGPVTTYGLDQVVTVNGESFSGATSRTGIFGLPANQTATVVYEAREFVGDVPDDLKRAAIEYALALLGNTKSHIPDNVETMQTNEATYRMVVPGQRGSDLGIPRVDAALKGYKRLTKDAGGIY